VRVRELFTRSPEETEAVGEALGRAAQGAELIGLVGELGSGKTCLVRGLARGLGIDAARVHSPSFTIVTGYRGGRLPLTHVDLYRLPGSEEDAELVREAIHGPGVAAVEWFDRLPPRSTADALVVRFRALDETTRGLRLEASDPRHALLLDAAAVSASGA
jgi:tRNA threonylcarbamoyladenosine biosynthesis protein TsaE